MASDKNYFENIPIVINSNILDESIPEQENKSAHRFNISRKSHAAKEDYRITISKDGKFAVTIDAGKLILYNIFIFFINCKKNYSIQKIFSFF
jgi:hypothetical protein